MHWLHRTVLVTTPSGPNSFFHWMQLQLRNRVTRSNQQPQPVKCTLLQSIGLPAQELKWEGEPGTERIVQCAYDNQEWLFLLDNFGSTGAAGWKDGSVSGKRAVGDDSGPSRRRQSAHADAKYRPKSVRVVNTQRIIEKHQALKVKEKDAMLLASCGAGAKSLNSSCMLFKKGTLSPLLLYDACWELDPLATPVRLVPAGCAVVCCSGLLLLLLGAFLALASAVERPLGVALVPRSCGL